MEYINIHEAKTHLSKYLEILTSSQETFIICKNGKPVAQLTAYQKLKSRLLGLLKGEVKLSKDFDEIPKKFIENFE